MIFHFQRHLNQHDAAARGGIGALLGAVSSIAGIFGGKPKAPPPPSPPPEPKRVDENRQKVAAQDENRRRRGSLSTIVGDNPNQGGGNGIATAAARLGSKAKAGYGGGMG